MRIGPCFSYKLKTKRWFRKDVYNVYAEGSIYEKGFFEVEGNEAFIDDLVFHLNAAYEYGYSSCRLDKMEQDYRDQLDAEYQEDLARVSSLGKQPEPTNRYNFTDCLVRYDNWINLNNPRDPNKT